MAATAARTETTAPAVDPESVVVDPTRMGMKKHRPFSELTKDWPPERVARNEAKVKEMLAELDRQERKGTPNERHVRRRT
ncbi:MAG: hypothetical protein F4Z04_13045 [Acidobacteria bacterium]|nr:hypothetical protein [Acidobacteriota bacterium]